MEATIFRKDAYTTGNLLYPFICYTVSDDEQKGVAYKVIVPGLWIEERNQISAA
jgi:hypothetical protein